MPILTTHVGSLIRPPELLAAIKAANEDSSKTAERDKIMRAAVHDIVRKQAEVGLGGGETAQNGLPVFVAPILVASLAADAEGGEPRRPRPAGQRCGRRPVLGSYHIDTAQSQHSFRDKSARRIVLHKQHWLHWHLLIWSPCPQTQ